MHAVVVGATGNVGTSVVNALAADDRVARITGIARRPPHWTVSKTTWAKADIATDELTVQFRDADVVIHLAWLFQPTHQPLTTWRANVLGSLRVFRAVANAGVPALVYASSVGAYSPGPKDRAVDEQWPTDGWPVASYSREKAYLERALDAFEATHPGIRLVRLRPAFVFQRGSASQQRRLFIGPLLPQRLVQPGRIPVVPDIPGLRLQAVHAADIGEAYRLAAVEPVRGAFNIAADPVVDARLLADCLDARVVPLPVAPVRAALSLAWHARLVPASPSLLDAALQFPIMDTSRARLELGWSPRYSARDAIEEFLLGLRQNSGMPTPPLAPEVPGGRLAELRSGAGTRP